MAYINLYDYIGDVRNKETCLKIMRDIATELQDDDYTDTELGRKLNSLCKQNKRFFTSSYREVDESNPYVFFMWLNTECTDDRGKAIYFQFSLSAFGWQGCYIGNEDEIIYNQLGKTKEDLDKELDTKESDSSVTSEVANVKQKDDYEDCDDSVVVTECVCTKRTSIDVEKTATFYSNLYDRLLIQKDWELTNNNLRNYIELLIHRLNECLKSKYNLDGYLVWNANKDKCMINSALLDKFGKSIMFITSLHSSKELSFTNLYLVDSKQMLIKNGFDKDVLKAKIDRIPFYNNSISELIFDADIDDFDLDNWDRLSHCIVDRRSRFPEPWSTKSTEQLCQDIINAIELGVRLSKYDSGYIKPFYNKRQNRIHYVIPYHLGNNFQQKPELGIIVAKTEFNLYQVMTILDYESCYINTKALSLYSDNSI